MGCCNINFFGAMPQTSPAVYSQGTDVNFFASTPVFSGAQSFCARPYASPLWEMDRQYNNAMIAASQGWINQNAMSSYLQPTAYSMPMSYSMPMGCSSQMSYSMPTGYGGYGAGYGQATPYDNIMQSYNQTCQQLAYFQGQLDMLRSGQSTGSANKKSNCGCGCGGSSNGANSAAKLTIPDAQNMLIMTGTGDYVANDNDNLIIDGGNCPNSKISAKGGDDYIESYSNYVEINPGEGNNVVSLNGQRQTVDATEGRNLIYVNSNNNTIIADDDDIIAISEEIDPSTVVIEGSYNPDNVCYIKDLTDAQKNPFQGAFDATAGEPVGNPANHKAEKSTAKDILTDTGKSGQTDQTNGGTATSASNNQAADQTGDATATDAAENNNQAADQTGGDENAVTTEDQDNAITSLESSNPDYDNAKEVFGKLAPDEETKTIYLSTIDLLKSANDILSSPTPTAESCNSKAAELETIISALDTTTLNDDTLPFHIMAGLKTKLEEKAASLSEATAAPETEQREVEPEAEQENQPETKTEKDRLMAEMASASPERRDEIIARIAEIDGGGSPQSSEETPSEETPSEEVPSEEAPSEEADEPGWGERNIPVVGSTLDGAYDATIGAGIDKAKEVYNDPWGAVSGLFS